MSEDKPIVITTCLLPRALHSRLRQYAYDNHISMSEVLRRLIDKHLP